MGINLENRITDRCYMVVNRSDPDRRFSSRLQGESAAHYRVADSVGIISQKMQRMRGESGEVT